MLLGDQLSWMPLLCRAAERSDTARRVVMYAPHATSGIYRRLAPYQVLWTCRIVPVPTLETTEVSVYSFMR
jgi:hypothetical protein